MRELHPIPLKTFNFNWMKNRNLLFTTALVLSSFVMNAQNTEQGDKILNLGVGLGNNYFSGNGYSTTFPPVAASFEVIVKDGLFDDGKGALGVGGQLGYVGYKYFYEGLGGSYEFDLGLGNGIGQIVDLSGIGSTVVTNSSKSKWKYNSLIIGPRGYLHYSFLDKLDTYTGVMLGLEFLSAKGGWSDKPKTTNSSTGFVWAWFVGGRYYFNDQFAAMLELGYGITYANIGIAYKF
jgi:hypothetical protein